MNVPAYLCDYADLYQTDPRAAALQWLRDAKYGLFVHYGLYSLLGRHEWVQLSEKIPVAQHDLLKDRFTAENFDAEQIARLAVEAEMKYVNLTTRHHENFCLWPSAHTDFHSVNAPCKRDLVGELARACERHDWDSSCITRMAAIGAIRTRQVTTDGAARRDRNTIRPNRLTPTETRTI